MSTHINHNNIKNINIATTTKKKTKVITEETPVVLSEA